MIRIAQLGLVLAAAALWGASRMTWVDVTSFDGLGQPRTATLSGGSWSTALVPLAVLLLATAIAALAVRGWPLRMLAVLAAVTSAGMGYLAISLWVTRDVGVRASNLADAPVADLVGTQRHYGGAVITVVAAVVTLACAVLLLRSATKERSDATRYARRTAAQADEPDDAISERQLWDALDEGLDPTQDRTNTDNKGR
ncbi:TIGR02234 family membrane protein [Mycolicibacterium tusciae]|uniref:TIGR02234 family membrane protein n=1 Tax=Mycolicibacterium tusciae TaxID=75922 RepID=UPI00024A47FE|nr:TIGR02234 family membrane protein [Mycolicibacterium tusciae]